MTNGYNLDFYAKKIFENEIERIDKGWQVDVGDMPFDQVRDHIIKQYFQDRIKEIDKEYQEH